MISDTESGMIPDSESGMKSDSESGMISDGLLVRPKWVMGMISD
jgi:hypothetical protein